ncbi:hypothetical protein SG34_007305 [Thalassomonas viridans]|uniref:Uncharacterized protein n=1 Tax=Thalassomonas viridans TaxID=137584 RepID=A0AAF0CBJ6_9GAMM|nr:hypothetical protein [Thalassomonas viridans]WDE06704.1 hypothetical protein SG34_007305 [Thalassomonas viridans]
MKKIITTAALALISNSLMAKVPVEGEDELPSVYRLDYTYDTVLKIGKPIQVEWSAFNADVCKLIVGSQVWDIPAIGEKSVMVTENSMTVTVDCSNGNGYDTKQKSFTAKDADHPELVSFSVSPDRNVMAGMQFTLSWDSDYAQSCKLYGTHDQTLAASGSKTFTAQEGVNSFNMVCHSADGRISNNRSRNISAVPLTPPVLSLFASSLNPLIGSFYSVIWSSQYADSCTLNGTPVALSGSRMEYAFGVKSYTFVCQGFGGTSRKSVLVMPE